jgi:membrane-bound metal-dependent hydrolase YbcI (DUF457 family)
MLVLGHAGITLGAAVLLAGVLGGNRSPNVMLNGMNKSLSPANTGTQNNLPINKLSSLVSLGRRIDIRLLLIGSLLPDIIDKPIGQLLFRETISNGRIFCHTLLFLILVMVAALFFYKRKGKTWLLALSFGTFMHLILDQMWHTPRTLLWPLLGLNFESIDLTDWLGNIWHVLFTDATVYIPELVGLLILVGFMLVLLYRHNTYAFIRYGRIK